MNADTVAEPGVLSEGRITRSTLRLAERPVYGLIIAIIALFVSMAAFTFSGQLKLLETEVNDQLRVVLPHHAAEQDKRISIITLTEETLIQFPYRSPVDRGFLAELLNVINEAGVKGVVIDILFDQPTEPEKDAALIAAMQAFDGPIVAAWGNEEAGLIKEQSDYLQAFAEETGVHMGFANVVTDADGVVRQFVTRLDGVEKLSMAGAMAVGILCVYVPGVVWLSAGFGLLGGGGEGAFMGYGWENWYAYGVKTFIWVDALKLVVAVIAFPVIWKMVGDARL